AGEHDAHAVAILRLQLSDDPLDRGRHALARLGEGLAAASRDVLAGRDCSDNLRMPLLGLLHRQPRPVTDAHLPQRRIVAHLCADAVGVLLGGVAHTGQVTGQHDIRLRHPRGELLTEARGLRAAIRGQPGVLLALIAALDVPQRLSVPDEVDDDTATHGVSFNQGRATGTADRSDFVYGCWGVAYS